MMFFSLSSTQWRRGAGRGGAFGWIAPLSGSLPPPSSRGERDKALIVIRLSSIAGILHPPQGVRHAQAHGLQRGKNSRDQTERDTEPQADEQIPGWKKEHRQQAARGVAAGNYQPRQSQAQCSAQDRQQARLGEHQPDDLSVGEADGLEHTQLAGPLAHRLRHGVAGHQQDGEKHRAEDGGDNKHDVADLARPRLHKRAFRLRLGFRRRILEFLVHPLCHFHRRSEEHTSELYSLPLHDALPISMLPIWLAHACTNAPSGSVLVSAAEFSNSWSTRFATSTACAGSFTRMVYQPTNPLPRFTWRFSSK